MAEYPDAIKVFLQLEDGVDTVVAAHPNDRGDEITAIETELGTNPKGDAADVASRLSESLGTTGKVKASYDSGWFSVAKNNTYQKTHNLNSTKLLILCYFSEDSGGANAIAALAPGYNDWYEAGGASNHKGWNVVIDGVNTVTLVCPDAFDAFSYWDTSKVWQSVDSGYARILILVLE